MSFGQFAKEFFNAIYDYNKENINDLPSEVQEGVGTILTSMVLIFFGLVLVIFLLVLSLFFIKNPWIILLIFLAGLIIGFLFIWLLRETIDSGKSLINQAIRQTINPYISQDFQNYLTACDITIESDNYSIVCPPV